MEIMNMDTNQSFASTIKEEIDQDDSRNFHTCDLCLYRTKSISTMLRHVRLHSSAKLFNCSQDSLSTYKCESCDFETHLKLNLHAHIKMTHENEEINQFLRVTFDLTEILKCYNCSDCNFRTYSSLVLMEHIFGKCAKKGNIEVEDLKGPMLDDEVSEDIEFVCAKTDIDLEDHVLKSLIASNITYEDLVFGAKNQHEVNQLANEEIKHYCCEHCSYKAKQKAHLMSHIVSKHTAHKDIMWFMCEKCSYKAKNKKRLTSHIVSRHTAHKDIKWFKCENCSYKTKTKYSVKLHTVRHHTAPQNIDCENCSFKAKFIGHLKRHMREKHTTSQNINWFECKNCSFKSKRKYSLRRHMIAKHTPPEKIQWFQCAKCSLKLKWKISIKKHFVKKHCASGSIKWWQYENCYYKPIFAHVEKF